MSKAATENTRTRRRNRIRARVFGTAERPRLAVFRSNRSIYAQLIDDAKGATLVSADSRKAKGKNSRERAEATGEALAEAAKKQGIEKVVFDRGGFRYQGTVALLADGARKGGLLF
jgi:large subunit ribosomal protein L18